MQISRLWAAEDGGVDSTGYGQAGGFHDSIEGALTDAGCRLAAKHLQLVLQLGQAVLSGMCAGVVRALDPEPVGERIAVHLLGLLTLLPVREQPGYLMPGVQRAGVVGAMGSYCIGEQLAPLTPCPRCRRCT
jgi:hypothetical protein